MPIDPSSAPAAELPSQRAEWDRDDVFPHHLGPGAGRRAAVVGDRTEERDTPVLNNAAIELRS